MGMMKRASEAPHKYPHLVAMSKLAAERRADAEAKAAKAKRKS